MRKAKKPAYPLTRHQSVHILREEEKSNGVHSATIGNYVDTIICGDFNNCHTNTNTAAPTGIVIKY